MTSAPTTNIPVAVPASAPPATIAGSLTGPRGLADRLLHGTPGRMRLFGLLGVLAALALGGVSANALFSSQAAVERAANNTEQVVRVQSIHVDLLRADAVATDAFLVGGLESPESRARYEKAMASVTTNIAKAAAAQPADGNALGALSQQVQTYAALVEQARANNRLGLPVGAQYLRQASAGLRADAVPIVAQVVATNEQRARTEFDRSNSVLQLLVGVVGLAGLVALAVWLARRTHRYLNASLTGAVALLGVGLVLAASTIGGIASATRGVADGSYKRAVTLATIRTAANDARANESLTLIARGSGKTFETAWATGASTVTNAIASLRDDTSHTEAWKTYTAVHRDVRRLDDGGKWEDAVTASTTRAAQAFDAFDASVTTARDGASRAAVDQLDGLGDSAPLYAVAIALGSLVAAWLVVRGIGQRVEEYR